MIGVSSKAVRLPKDLWKNPILDSGFEALEINLSWTPLPFSEERLERLRKVLASHSMKTSMHTGARGLLHPDKFIAEGQLMRFKTEIWQGEMIGAEEIVLHLPYFLNLPNQLNQVIQLLSQLSDFADQHGIKIMFENDSTGPFSKPETLRKIFTEVHGISMNLDIGHLHRMKYEGIIQDELDFVRDFSENIRYVHVHDNNGAEDEHVGVGKGDIDFNSLLRELKKSNIRKWICETQTLEDALSTKEFLISKLNERA